MGFKIPMAKVEKEDLQKIRADRPTGGYDGPTPPPGLYDAKVAKIWFAETKTGKPAVKVSFVFDNEGEDAVYNGASTIQNYLIPTDPSEKAFVPQVNQLDAFFAALTGGKQSYDDFQDAISEGRTDADPTKKDKIGIPVTQIGKFKLTGTQKIRIKTKIREYNGNEYIDIHYIPHQESAKTKPETTDEFEDAGSEDDSLAAWMASDD